MSSPASTTAAQADPARERFLQRLAQGLGGAGAAGPHWQRLLLVKPVSAAAGVHKVLVRPLLLRGQWHLSFVTSHTTKDITHNLPLAQGLAQVAQLLGASFRNAHLFTATDETQLSLSKKGKGLMAVKAAATSTSTSTAATAETPAPDAPPSGEASGQASGHDRQKQRLLQPDRPFLAALGVTTAQGQLVPAMARKWKQINKFLEVFSHALATSRLTDQVGAAGQPPLRVVDFGAGKAYLSFALHDWLTHSQGLNADVVAVELRADLVAQGQHTVRQLGLQGMQVQVGDVRLAAGQATPQPMHVMVALHACDTATDHALYLGLQAGASIILCSPCCHKQLRPQLLSPHPLKSVFAHGIHVDQHAEMATDSLRALLLQAQGYDTQVFEFIALEHTRKNKMILAIKRAQPKPALVAAALQQVQELKQFYGVQEQALQTLLAGGVPTQG
jgi:Methyltransferase domain